MVTSGVLFVTKSLYFGAKKLIHTPWLFTQNRPLLKWRIKFSFPSFLFSDKQGACYGVKINTKISSYEGEYLNDKTLKNEIPLSDGFKDRQRVAQEDPITLVTDSVTILWEHGRHHSLCPATLTHQRKLHCTVTAKTSAYAKATEKISQLTWALIAEG